MFTHQATSKETLIRLLTHAFTFKSTIEICENDHGGHRNLFFSKINPWQPLGPLLKVRLLVELNSKELCGNKANLHPFRGRPNTGDRNRSHRVVQQPLNLWLRCSQEKLKCFLMGLLTSHTSQQNVASTLW